MEVGQSYASESPNTPQQDAPVNPPKNFISRLIGVWFSPGETFAEMKWAPKLLLPLIFFPLLIALTQFVVTNRYGYEKIVRKQIEMQGEMMQKMNVPEDKIEEAKQKAEEGLKPEKMIRGKIGGAVGAAFGALVLVLIVAGVFKLYCLMMGKESTFTAILAAVVYSYLAVGIASFAITTITLYIKNPDDIDVMNPLASNLGAILSILGTGLPKFVIGLASYIDVFSFWRIALLSIGCAAVTTKMKSLSASIPHILLFLIAALVGSFFSSMMS